MLSGLWILLVVDNLHLKGVLHDFFGFAAVSHVIQSNLKDDVRYFLRIILFGNMVYRIFDDESFMFCDNRVRFELMCVELSAIRISDYQDTFFPIVTAAAVVFVVSAAAACGGGERWGGGRSCSGPDM